MHSEAPFEKCMKISFPILSIVPCDNSTFQFQEQTECKIFLYIVTLFLNSAGKTAMWTPENVTANRMWRDSAVIAANPAIFR